MLLNVSVVVPQVSLFCCFSLHVECVMCLAYAYLRLPLGVSVFLSNENSERCDEQKPSFLFLTGGGGRCALPLVAPHEALRREVKGEQLGHRCFSTSERSGSGRETVRSSAFHHRNLDDR